ncbi:Endolytic peptidoglycan transglycosylase RlpA [Andreprevotia sp. IGB-42]|uniref:septal ring lytic transglycosylase RlpA family protein n=1 Tax=Andreprevotia sp. IGB-42 TaxID=2497473 RepID=UPI00135AFEF6|nr:septal ring lytic transglycosylase RlpA family protein [Andreprevotia sp. IGB-42]KAF0813816.1 Endolytic peptidoglycan transglycosylase RlpA [Andreprevotia sp. IGB-42]
MAHWKLMTARRSIALFALLLAACGSPPRQNAPVAERPDTGKPAAPAIPQAGTPSAYTCTYAPSGAGKGGFYKDDGPMDQLPASLDLTPEPIPRWEPLHRYANNPYTVLGLSFTPLKTPGSLTEQGMGSWYGRKFHGQKTSSGEVYDMFQMTAASPILPIPSYARVTNVKNGRSVIVRVNDRGPFHKGRVMDLSFLAACRLGYAMNGSTELKVESLLPGDAPVAVAAASARVTPAPQPAAPTAAQPEKVPVSTAKDGVYLQLAAFGNLGNAEAFREKWARLVDDGNKQVLIQSSANLHRVRLGPYPDRQAALAAAERITGEHNLQAVVAK